MTTMLANRDPADLEGVAVHVYACNRDMARVFVDADGELVFLPQSGRLTILTELGRIDIAPGQIALVPRGVRFRVELPDGEASGYVAENHGSLFRLPDLGPIGANGLGNPRDFETPVAWFEDRDEPTQVVQKFLGSLWTMTLDHSPLDVVAWHGNLAPWRYDLSRFNTINTVSFDHPDPSIFTLLTSPSDVPGRANADLVLFPPRWMVAEDVPPALVPPQRHVEAMGLITGAYDAKAKVSAPAAVSAQSDGGHGPDLASWQAASTADLRPHRIEGRWRSWWKAAGPIGPPPMPCRMRSSTMTRYGRTSQGPAAMSPRSTAIGGRARPIASGWRWR
jgi:homogentisate 1,2-dioxygenase